MPEDNEVGQNIAKLRKARSLSQERLAKLAGVSQTTIDKIEKGQIRRSRYLPELAQALEVEIGDLDSDFRAVVGPEEKDKSLVIRTVRSFKKYSPNQIPVYATRELNDPDLKLPEDLGTFFVHLKPIRVADWPSAILSDPDSYCLYISEDSMHPEFEPGDIAIVDPSLPPIPNTSCVFYYTIHDGSEVGIIARLAFFDKESWSVRKWSQDSVRKLGRPAWDKCHRIVVRNLR